MFSGGRLVTPRYPIIFVVYKKKQPVRMSTKKWEWNENEQNRTGSVCVWQKISLYQDIRSFFGVYEKQKQLVRI